MHIFRQTVAQPPLCCFGATKGQNKGKRQALNSDHELDGKWHKLAMEHYKQLILQFCILRKLYLLFEVSFLSVYSALVRPSLACQYNVISYNLTYLQLFLHLTYFSTTQYSLF